MVQKILKDAKTFAPRKADGLYGNPHKDATDFSDQMPYKAPISAQNINCV